MQNLNCSPEGVLSVPEKFPVLPSVLFIVDGMVENDVVERDVVAKVVGSKISFVT
jgi:hypothetical protein